MINIEHNTEENIIRAMEDGNEVGNIEYEVGKGVMTITHTRAHVQGRGLGRILVAAAIDYARSKGMKIIPQCSFAKSLMEIVEEYHNIIYEVGSAQTCNK